MQKKQGRRGGKNIGSKGRLVRTEKDVNAWEGIKVVQGRWGKGRRGQDRM